MSPSPIIPAKCKSVNGAEMRCSYSIYMYMYNFYEELFSFLLFFFSRLLEPSGQFVLSTVFVINYCCAFPLYLPVSQGKFHDNKLLSLAPVFFFLHVFIEACNVTKTNTIYMYMYMYICLDVLGKYFFPD